MDPLSIAGSITQVIQLTSAVQLYFSLSTSNSISYLKLYGISGILVEIFGNNDVWRMQAQVLGSLNDDDALTFRQSIQNECNMEAVAVGAWEPSSNDTELKGLGRYRCANSDHSFIASVSQPDSLGGAGPMDIQSYL